jgi:hypothetical protein
LVFGIWYLVFGIWYLVFGIWYLVFGIWYFIPSASPAWVRIPVASWTCINLARDQPGALQWLDLLRYSANRCCDDGSSENRTSEASALAA